MQISEAVVIGVPDVNSGERVIAILLPKDSSDTQSLSMESIRQFLADRLAPYKQPKSIFIAKSIPRNALGKVYKHIQKQILNIISIVFNRFIFQG